MNEMRFREGAAVRALDGMRLMVLAMPFGSPSDRDHLNEYFSARTDFMLDVGDRRPALYFHGFTSEKKMTKKPTAIGIATLHHIDEEGGWMEVGLKTTPLNKKLYASAEAGTCRASTGAVNYLCRTSPDGEVEVWPIGELSLIDEGPGRHPANDKAIAVPLKALFAELDLDVPEAFGAMENGEDAVRTVKAPIGDEMADEEIVVEKEEVPEPVPAAKPAEEPKYRAMFSTKKETVGEPKGDAGKEESWRWFWHLRHGSLGDKPSMRVLEETQAAEGLPMVPQDALDSIVSLRDETSVASRAGLTRYKTDRLIFNLPREVTAMTALAATAEEGAYVEQEPVFGLAAYTVVKYTNMVSATEELLEDQDLFIPWFTANIGRAWALAENAALYTAADVAGNGTVGVAVASDTLTIAEFNEFFWTMQTPYRDNCVLIMNPATMGVLYALQLGSANPYAFGPYPAQERTPMGVASINGLPVHLCSDWLAWNAAANLQCVLSMANRDYCGIIERRGLTIKVDPYGAAATGVVRYFPSARFVPFFSQALAHVVKNGLT